jgi:hypothetical protein
MGGRKPTMNDPDKPEIKPGTLVKLKSGGPRMTVTFTNGDHCDALYFTPDDQLHAVEGIHVGALRVVSETEPA